MSAIAGLTFSILIAQTNVPPGVPDTTSSAQTQTQQLLREQTQDQVPVSTDPLRGQRQIIDQATAAAEAQQEAALRADQPARSLPARLAAYDASAQQLRTIESGLSRGTSGLTEDLAAVRSALSVLLSQAGDAESTAPERKELAAALTATAQSELALRDGDYFNARGSVAAAGQALTQARHYAVSGAEVVRASE